MRKPHMLPRRAWRYEVQGTLAEKLTKLSARQQYIIEQSVLRWERRHNEGEKITLLRGHIGHVDGFRIILTDPA
jgi:hypothetical protein